MKDAYNPKHNLVLQRKKQQQQANPNHYPQKSLSDNLQ
jgi:hypothetical protein